MFDTKLKVIFILISVLLPLMFFSYKYFTTPPAEVKIETRIEYKDKIVEVEKKIDVIKEIPIIQDRVITKTSKCSEPDKIIEEKIVEKYVPGKEVVIEKEVEKEVIKESKKEEKKTESDSTRHQITLQPRYNLDIESKFSIELDYKYFPYENLGIGPSIELNKDFNKIESIGLGLTIRF